MKQTDTETFIRQTRAKFFIFTALGLAIVLAFSVFAFGSHRRAIGRQAALQELSYILSRQLGLIYEVTGLSEKYVDRLPQTTQLKLQGLLDAKIKDFEAAQAELRQWHEFRGHEFPSVTEVMEKERLDEQINIFINHAKSLVEVESPSFDEKNLDAQYIASQALMGLTRFYNYVFDEIEIENRSALASLDRVGVLLILTSLAVILVIWAVVFHPLYVTAVSQHRSLIDSLYMANEASRAKTEFLANVSHEIRTPMTAILGYVDLMKRGGDLKKQDLAAGLEIIHRNARHLLALIDEILDVSRVEAGKVEIVRESASPAIVVEDVMKLLKVKAEEKGLTFECIMDESVPKLLWLDPKRLKQILFNIIGNAVKFTQEGGVRIFARYNPRKEKLKFLIKDTGIGIAKENQEKVFRPFEQAEAAVGRKWGGTGLGLALARTLAEKMDGTVTIAESELKKGTTFAVEIRAEPCEGKVSTGAEDMTAATQLKNLNGVSVLVVDDAEENAHIFKTYLQNLGAKPFVATTGDRAVRMLGELKIDLVLLDLQLPGRDGFAVIQDMRGHGFWGPVVALTAHAMPEDKLKTRMAGFAGHITKPTTQSELFQQIAAVLWRERHGRYVPC